MSPVQKIKARLFSSKGWVLLDQVVFSATSFLTTILLARNLGVQSFGAYSLIVLYLYLLLSVSSAMIAGPFQVLYSKSNKPAKYISSLTLLQVFVCLLFSLLTIFIASFKSSLMPGLRENLLPLIILVAGFLLQDYFRRIFLVIDQPRSAFITDAVSGVLQLAGLVFLSFTGTLTLQNGFYVIGLTYVPSVFFAVYTLKLKGVTAADISTCFRQHMQNGKWLLATSFLQWWANNFLMATAGLFVGFAALGALRLAQTLFGVLNAVLQVLENYALPRATAILQKENTESFRCYLRTAGKQTLFFSLPFLMLAMIFPGQILLIAGGQQYTAYSYALQGMALLYTVILFGYPVRLAIRALLLNKEFFAAYAVSGAFSLLAVKYIVQNWQLAGVISALLINQVLMLGYWHWVLARKKFMIWK